VATTAPPKPSAQTTFILDAMSKSADEKNRWDQVLENFDLLFARVNDIGSIQQELKTELTANKEEQRLISEQSGQMAKQLPV
jgi:hypothetical protein